MRTREGRHTRARKLGRSRRRPAESGRPRTSFGCCRICCPTGCGGSRCSSRRCSAWSPPSAIPLMTKAVIDGPVRHQDQRGCGCSARPRSAVLASRGGAVVHPPLAGGPRHHGRRGRHPQGPLRAAADPADVVPRQVAVRPAAVARDERPQHHPPVPVVRAALPAAQHHSDHRRDGHPAGDVLAARRRRGGVDRADHRDRAALPAPVHQAVPRCAGPVRQRRNARRGAGARAAGGQGVRPRAVRLRAVRRARHRRCSTPRCARSGCRRSSGRCSRSSRTSR